MLRTSCSTKRAKSGNISTPKKALKCDQRIDICEKKTLNLTEPKQFRLTHCPRIPGCCLHSLWHWGGLESGHSAPQSTVHRFEHTSSTSKANPGWKTWTGQEKFPWRPASLLLAPPPNSGTCDLWDDFLWRETPSNHTAQGRVSKGDDSPWECQTHQSLPRSLLMCGRTHCHDEVSWCGTQSHTSTSLVFFFSHSPWGETRFGSTGLFPLFPPVARTPGGPHPSCRKRRWAWSSSGRGSWQLWLVWQIL